MLEITNYISKGFFHVLDVKALDHVLFFVALTIIFSFKNWKKALLLVTFFTISHTLTFALSVYDYIYVKSQLVEFLILLTVLITLILNIYYAIKKRAFNNTNIYFAFFFGLIHGLGFSSYFTMRIDDSQAILLPLLKFAIGIEFAQIIVVLFVLSISYIFIEILKINKRKWILVISSLLLVYTTVLLVLNLSSI